LTKARFEIVRTAGHWVEMEQPVELTRLVRGFIEEN